MNESQSKSIDLQQLAIERKKAKNLERSTVVRWLTRYVIPLMLGLGFLALFGWAMRDSFLPASQVSVAPVMVMKGTFVAADAPIFQAAGWVEPRPAPIVASALAGGVVQEMHVVEGDYVEKGDRLATLIDTDAKLALREANANHQLQTAELLRAKTVLESAEEILQNPLDLQAKLADGNVMVAEAELAVSNLPYQIHAARTQQELAKANLEGKRRAGDAIAGRALREAESTLAVATEKYEELIARQPRLKSQLESFKVKRQAAERKLEMKIDEKRAVEVARANLEASKAQLLQTELALEAARIQLERMVVKAPISGFILSIDARTGQRLSGLNPHSEQGSAAVGSLYDPEHLQVRVDVRLEDIAQVSPSQKTQIETVAAKKPVAGEVISITTKADIQKNTLQVKVALLDPPSVIKPEMLAKVTFLAQSAEKSSDTDHQAVQILIPLELTHSQGERVMVWVADRSRNAAEEREVTLGAPAADGIFVEVKSGLTPTDKLIIQGREGLADGTRIRIVGEDDSLANMTTTVVQ